MKKRLLFATMAMVCAASAFAFSEGEYVFTKTNRVRITGENLLTNGSFENSFEGWTDVEGKTVNAEAWGLETGQGENGESVAQSLTATPENGALCQIIAPDAGTYLVSYQIKAAGETTSGTTTIGTTVGTNYADIFVNATGVLAKAESTDGAPVISVATAQYFDSEWTTVSYFVTVEEGQFIVIHFENMYAGVQITNVALNECIEVYDTREAQRKVTFVKQLLEDPNFNTDDAQDAKESVEAMIEAIEDQYSGDADQLESILEAYDGTVAEYLNVTSHDIAMNNFFNYIEDLTAFPKRNRGYIGEAEIIGGFRFYGENWLHGDGAEHLNKQIQGTYNTNSGDGKVALYSNKMPAGKYYVAAEMRNAYCDKNYNYTYTLEQNVRGFVGGNEKTLGTIVGEDYVKFYYIAEYDGMSDFEAGFIWEGCETGSAFNIKNFEIRSFEDVEDHVEHLEAWALFITQYNALVSAHDRLHDMIGDNSYPWEQATLTEAAGTYDGEYDAFIAQGWVTADGQDSGVASTDDMLNWYKRQGGSDEDIDYRLVRGYQNAINTVVDANKPISDLLDAINNAKAVRNNPKNANADKSIIDPVIEEATKAYKDIAANTNDDRREADVATIEKMIAALQEAADAFEATADVKPFIDINFANAASENSSGFYEIAGEKGTMELSVFDTDNDSSTGFAQGYQDALTDVLRVGKGTGTVQLGEEIGDNEILEVKFDLWVGNLIKRYVYVELRNANNEKVAGFSMDRYNGIVSYNDFNDDSNSGMDILGYVTGVGSSAASNGAICVDNNKSSFTLTVNYASNTIQGKVVNGKNGTCDGSAMPIPQMDDTKITQFVIGSGYDNKDRRCWFDNLQISKFGNTGDAVGIQGDVNGDGSVDVADISNILTIMAAGTNDPAGDVNGDSSVDVADISNVLSIMAGK